MSDNKQVLPKPRIRIDEFGDIIPLSGNPRFVRGDFYDEDQMKQAIEADVLSASAEAVQNELEAMKHDLEGYISANHQLLEVTKKLVSAMRQYEIDVDELPIRAHHNLMVHADAVIESAKAAVGQGDVNKELLEVNQLLLSELLECLNLLSAAETCSRNNFLNLALERVDAISKTIKKSKINHA